MPDDYPSQSHASREPRKIEPVTTTEARVRKTPMGRRFRETFIQGNAQSTWSYMLWEVFFPGARDVIADGFHEGIDQMLGGARGGFRRPNRGRSSFSGNSQISKHNPDRALGHAPSSIERFSDEDRRKQDTSVIEIDSRVEAEEVLSQMNLLIDQFDVCSLADFYQMVRITPTTADYKFGWESLGNSRVVGSRGSFYLDLPPVAQLR